MKKQLLTLLLVGMTTLTAFAQVPSYVPTNGLVGWWPFNGDAQDESGNGNNGTVNGATLTTDRNGISNKAYSFNGTSNYIKVNDNISFNFTSHTISYWYLRSALPVSQTGSCSNIGNEMLISKGRDIYTNSISITHSNDGGTFQNYVISNSKVNNNIVLSNWTSVVLTYDASTKTQSLFQDGILISTKNNIVFNSNLNTNPLGFGTHSEYINSNLCSFFYKGNLDDIAIYNRALTQQEITALYNGCTTPTVTITPQSTNTFCQGGSVILNASTGAGNTYEWYKDGNLINGSTTSSYTANQTGSYTVKVINGSCNATSAATAVTINPNPTATITPQTSTTFCQGGSVNLNASTGTNYTYEWYNNGNVINNATNSVYNATQSGNYTVKVTNAACNATSTATVVTVNTNPTVTLNSLNPFSLKTSLPVQLVGNPSGGTYSGDAVSGSIFTPANASLGKKTIAYNYTSLQGCSGSASQTTIVVDSVGNVCSTYDTLKIKVHFTLGLYANTTNTIKFYPNPTKDILFIDNGNYQAMSGYSIKIVSLAGAVVYNQPITSQQVQISMNQFASKGLYIAQIIDSNNAIVDAKKIVLE